MTFTFNTLVIFIFPIKKKEFGYPQSILKQKYRTAELMSRIFSNAFERNIYKYNGISKWILMKQLTLKQMYMMRWHCLIRYQYQLVWITTIWPLKPKPTYRKTNYSFAHYFPHNLPVKHRRHPLHGIWSFFNN